MWVLTSLFSQQIIIRHLLYASYCTYASTVNVSIPLLVIISSTRLIIIKACCYMPHLTIINYICLTLLLLTPLFLHLLKRLKNNFTHKGWQTSMMNPRYHLALTIAIREILFHLYTHFDYLKATTKHHFLVTGQYLLSISKKHFLKNPVISYLQSLITTWC